ncbi:MAG: hypothetical protein WA056_13345 [Gallionella sp.]
MKQPSSVCLMKLLALMLASLLSLSGIAVEPVKGVQTPSAIDLTLPIHQQPKLHPELLDPVLGDQAQIVEWAWSPQYAERFGLQPQSDGLPNGGLWLVGVKIERKQYQQWQRYTCNIIGLMQNNLPILTPPGEIYTIHPLYQWFGGLPPSGHYVSDGVKVEAYTPFQYAWYKQPKNKLEQTRPERSITLTYLFFYRHFQSDLAYFEIETGCGYFNDPRSFHNEFAFPKDMGSKIDSVRAARRIPNTDVINYNRFALPDALMTRTYPYIREADDWTSCLMRRSGQIGRTLTLRATKSKRFGNTCEPTIQKQK